jgi:hypothetical protein
MRAVHAVSLRHQDLLDTLRDRGVRTSSLAIVDQDPNGNPKDSGTL